MSKEELSQIYYLNREIKMWQKELERLECQSLLKGQQLSGMPSGGGNIDKVGGLAVKKTDIQLIIEGKLKEIQLQRERIIGYINSIEDSMMRQIVFYRNVSCMSWRQVAMEIGGDNTEEGIKKIYQRFLKKIKVVPFVPSICDRM